MKIKKLRFLCGSRFVYSVGVLLAGVGVLLFLVEILAVVQNPAVFSESGTGGRSLLMGALAGVGLVLVGFTAMTACARSVSVVGFGLEPKLNQDEQRMSSVVDVRTPSNLHCESCSAVNAENAKFCNQCGTRY